ncbi:MAG: aspartate aminotransferase family protein [Gemmatimonadales bacterium]
MDTQVVPAISRQEEVYRLRTPASRRFFAEARRFLPGGDSRSTLFYRPYPAVMDRGEGCRLSDIDGNHLLDFTGNHSSLVHGYGHPAIVAAVEQQLRKGTCFPGSTEPQLQLAQLLCERIESVERIRFTNSGTEATTNAIRAAREFTGRTRIAKVEGGYHGTMDEVMVSAGTVVIPFNDIEGAAAILEAEGSELAAVLVEPVLGSAGMIPAERDYLEMLRETTHRHGVLLVCDEVVSFRVAHGGAQECFGLTPDLTCLGKLIGGGFPLGAFGGRADIMALFDPSLGPPALPHPGSYNGNPVSMVAGAATLDLLTPAAIERLNTRGTALRQDLATAFSAAGIPAQITGLGSLFAIHLSGEPVRSYRDTLGAQTDLRHEIFLGLFNEGILIDPRGVGNISTVIGDEELDRFSRAARSVLDRLV